MGPGRIWARAHMGPAPKGPEPKWDPGPKGDLGPTEMNQVVLQNNIAHDVVTILCVGQTRRLLKVWSSDESLGA